MSLGRLRGVPSANEPSCGVLRRHIPTRAVKKRITSTKNIRKITSSMKMVSAAKMRGDEARLRAGKLFGVRAHARWPQSCSACMDARRCDA